MIRGLAILSIGFALAGCMPDDTEIDPESLGLPSREAGTSGGGVPTAGRGTAGTGTTATAGSGTAGRGAGGSIATAGRGGTAGRGAAGASAAGRGGAAGATAGTGAAAGRGGAGGTGGRAGAGGMGGRGGAGASGAGAGGRGGAGGGGGAGAAGGGGGASGGDGPTFADVYALFEDHCNGCHGPGEGGLTTNSEMTAYDDLVDADSEACAGKKRVAPGDPNNSVLFLAINRTSADGCNPPDMPGGGAPKWAQADIDTVRNWIMAGAPE